MKLYDKKFLIYGNCMIRSFGQPGSILMVSIRFGTRLLGYQGDPSRSREVILQDLAR